MLRSCCHRHCTANSNIWAWGTKPGKGTKVEPVKSWGLGSRWMQHGQADRVCRPQARGGVPSAEGVEADVPLRVSERPGEPDELWVSWNEHLGVDLVPEAAIPSQIRRWHPEIQMRMALKRAPSRHTTHELPGRAIGQSQAQAKNTLSRNH